MVSFIIYGFFGSVHLAVPSRLSLCNGKKAAVVSNVLDNYLSSFLLVMLAMLIYSHVPAQLQCIGAPIPQFSCRPNRVHISTEILSNVSRARL